MNYHFVLNNNFKKTNESTYFFKKTRKIKLKKSKKILTQLFICLKPIKRPVARQAMKFSFYLFLLLETMT